MPTSPPAAALMALVARGEEYLSAISKLSSLGPEGWEPLVSLLKNEDPGVRLEAAVGLAKIDKEKAKQVFATHSESDPDVAAVIKQLVEGKNILLPDYDTDPQGFIDWVAENCSLEEAASLEDTFEPALPIFEDDGDPSLQKTLAMRGKPEHIDQLIQTAEEHDPELRLAAVTALAHMTDEKVREKATKALLLAASDRSSVIRMTAIWGLTNIAKPSLDIQAAFEKGLKDPEANIRWRSAVAAGKMKIKALGADLTKALEDPDATVRRQSAWALGELLFTDAGRPLTHLSMRDKNPLVREAARAAVEKLKAHLVSQGVATTVESVEAPMSDREATFLAAFGLGPKYVPKPRQTRECTKCGGKNAYVREEGADCDAGQNEMVVYCPDCRASVECGEYNKAMPVKMTQAGCEKFHHDLKKELEQEEVEVNEALVTDFLSGMLHS